MSRHVPDDDLEKMKLMVSTRIRKVEGMVWLEYNGEALIDGHDLLALLDELLKRRINRRGNGSQLAQITETLMAMNVGDSIEIMPVATSSMRTYRRTARARMGNPNAVWHGVTLKSGKYRLTRVPDGTNRYYSRRSPYITELAGMEIGHSTILPITFRQVQALKAPARAEMNYPGANWSYQTLVNGRLRVRRIS